MITTEGFRDILHIARHKKPLNFSIQQDLPWQARPLVKRRNRRVVAERVTATHGEIVTPLDEEAVRLEVGGRGGVVRGGEGLETEVPRGAVPVEDFRAEEVRRAVLFRRSRSCASEESRRV